MAEADPTTFGPKAVEQIAKTVREVARRMQNETPHRGRWQQRQGGGGGGGDIIQFKPIDVCEGVGFVCDCVTAEVVTASCGSSLQPGDTLQVWDQSRGWFQMDPELLFNSVGWAHKVKTTETDPYSLPFDIGPCRWVVFSMDCVEQDPE